MTTFLPCLVLLFAAFAQSASAFDAVLTDDTSLRLCAKPLKAGALPLLAVDATQHALLKFDLSSLPPGRTAANVLSATLTVYLSRVTKPGAVSLYKISGHWQEEAIPVVSFAPLSGQTGVIGAGSAKNFLRFDVTNLVKSWVDGSVANEGVAIGADANGPGVMIAFDSKENTASGHSPKLDIEFVDQSALSQSYKGAWNAGTAYQLGDLVSSGGSTWIALGLNANSSPATGNANWSSLAQKGETGDQGAQGSPGAQGPQGVQGSPGVQGFPGLQGATGAQGAPGPQGVPGLQGAPGAQGTPGVQGASGAFIQSYKGAWSAAVSYALGDIVTDAGAAYLAVAPSSGSRPASGNPDWNTLAERGAPGPQGLPATISAGSVPISAIAFPSTRVSGNLSQYINKFAGLALWQWNAEDFDTASMHDLVQRNSRVTVPVHGLYWVTYHEIITSDVGSPNMSLWKNGVGSGTKLTEYANAFEKLLELNAGDYLEWAAEASYSGLFTRSGSSFGVSMLSPLP